MTSPDILPEVRLWYLYMLECAGGRLYTGITLDVAARYKAHTDGRGAKFTRAWPPERVVLVRAYASRTEAAKAEYAIKQLPPAEKRRLIRDAPAEETRPFR